tara:strand:- start:221 stop:439 length:219 start_codon:yes stop_codon:yes gene_type:complete
MNLSPESVKKKSLEWQEELKRQRDRLGQAQSVVSDATQKIAMLEGGLQFAESLLSQDIVEPETEGAVTIGEE